jgi:uncharacterized protein (TIRG00374 family)
MKKTLFNIIKFGFTAGILFYLYDKGMLDFSRVKSVYQNPKVLIFCFLGIYSTVLATVLRWWLLLQGQELKVSFKEAFNLTMIGVFFNTALPGAVSGDVVKGYYVVRKQPSGRGRIKAFTTLLIDRILGMSGLVVVAFFSMLYNFSELYEIRDLKPLILLISGLFVGVLVFFCLILIDLKFLKQVQKFLTKLPLGDYFSKLFEAVKAYESDRKIIYRGLIVSAMIHLVIITVIYVLASSLGGFDSIPLSKFYFLVPFGLLVTAIPIAPAGLGTGHAAFFLLFQKVGSERGADLFTLFVSFQLFISLLGGIFYLKHRENAPLSKKLAVSD